MPTPVKAAVLNAPDGQFRIEDLVLRDPGEGEILVRLASAGICHTDVKVGQGYIGVPLPVVLGHEGAGIVERVGSGVTDLAPGDRVALSFPYCGSCPQCLDNHPAYCDTGQLLTFSCRRDSRPPPYAGDSVHGWFFGQSSFATHTVCDARSAIRVAAELPTELLGPLGCGFQTGAGAVLNVMAPKQGSSLAVFGAGNVGLAAVMAARIAGMDPVIAVDRQPARLALALELGATHVIDTGAGDPADKILQLTGGLGVNFSLDTTNNPEMVRRAFEALANRGTCVHAGGGGQELCFPGTHLLHGRTVTGCIQGDSNPRRFIPQLLAYHREGRFPFDRLLTFYPLAEINTAVADMHAGRVVKPVLRMPARRG